MKCNDVKQYKQLTVFNDLKKYDIVYWKMKENGDVDKIGIKGYHPEENITWVGIDHVNFVSELEDQDPNTLFKRRR